MNKVVIVGPSIGTTLSVVLILTFLKYTIFPMSWIWVLSPIWLQVCYFIGLQVIWSVALVISNAFSRKQDKPDER